MIKAEHIFIFTGPTLSPVSAAGMLDAIYLPPVKMGDLYRICKLFSPRVIAIIDGYFNQVPAVWHKEIHYALSQGIQVYGAASMGALRAAEMAQLGMIGCGEIYHAFQRGILTPFDDEVFDNDDEVAVIHGPPELNYLAASDALVNMRYTLAAAMQAQIIDKDVGRQLLEIAKNLFYAQRSYTELLKTASGKKLPAGPITTLKDWLDNNKTDQKQQDAITLLETIRRPGKLNGQSAAACPSFEITSQWQAATEEIDRSHFRPHPLINELRLEGTAGFKALEQTLGDMPPMASRLSPFDPTQLNRLHGTPAKLEARLSERWQQMLPHPDSAPARRAHQEAQLLNQLDKSGALTRLKERAEHKQSILEQMPNHPAVNSLSELDRLQLCDWYFSSRLDTHIPDHLCRYTAQLGLLDEDEFYAMLLAEYLYLESQS